MSTLKTIFNFLKDNEKLLLYILLLLCVVFWNRSCTNQVKTKTITVEVPAKNGSLQSKIQPKHKPIDIDRLAQFIKDTMPSRIKIIRETVPVAQKKNDSLLKAYNSLKSEFERYKLFQNFISTKSFNQKFQDKYLSASVTGVVRGEVESINLDYTIKPRQIKTDIEVKNYRWVIGPQVGVSYINQNITPYIGVGLTYRVIRF